MRRVGMTGQPTALPPAAAADPLEGQPPRRRSREQSFLVGHRRGLLLPMLQTMMGHRTAHWCSTLAAVCPSRLQQGLGMAPRMGCCQALQARLLWLGHWQLGQRWEELLESLQPTHCHQPCGSAARLLREWGRRRQPQLLTAMQRCPGPGPGPCPSPRRQQRLGAGSSSTGCRSSSAGGSAARTPARTACCRAGSTGTRTRWAGRSSSRRAAGRKGRLRPARAPLQMQRLRPPAAPRLRAATGAASAQHRHRPPAWTALRRPTHGLLRQ